MIRTAQPADLDAIAALHTRARATYYRGRIPEEAYGGAAELARTREGWSRAVARDAADGGVLCAEQDGELTGVAAFRTARRRDHPHPAPRRPRPLAPRHRSGPARRLPRRLARAPASARVRLEVYEHNLRAQAFYATHGWLPDPVEPAGRGLPPHPLAHGGRSPSGE